MSFIKLLRSSFVLISVCWCVHEHVFSLPVSTLALPAEGFTFVSCLCPVGGVSEAAAGGAEGGAGGVGGEGVLRGGVSLRGESAADGARPQGGAGAAGAEARAADRRAGEGERRAAEGGDGRHCTRYSHWALSSHVTVASASLTCVCLC